MSSMSSDKLATSSGYGVFQDRDGAIDSDRWDYLPMSFPSRFDPLSDFPIMVVLQHV